MEQVSVCLTVCLTVHAEHEAPMLAVPVKQLLAVLRDMNDTASN